MVISGVDGANERKTRSYRLRHLIIIREGGTLCISSGGSCSLQKSIRFLSSDHRTKDHTKTCPLTFLPYSTYNEPVGVIRSHTLLLLSGIQAVPSTRNSPCVCFASIKPRTFILATAQTMFNTAETGNILLEAGEQVGVFNFLLPFLDLVLNRQQRTSECHGRAYLLHWHPFISEFIFPPWTA